MPHPPPILERPQRWDAALDPEMQDATVDRLLSTAPFARMKPGSFPSRLPLGDILKHDTRLHTFRRGEIVMREGDYGTSAFLVLSGVVRVVLRPGLPASALGRRPVFRKNIFKAVAQLWAYQKEPESFSLRDLKTGLVRLLPQRPGRRSQNLPAGRSPHSRRAQDRHPGRGGVFWRNRRSEPHAPHRLDFRRKRAMPNCWKFAGRACAT